MRSVHFIENLAKNAEKPDVQLHSLSYDECQTLGKLLINKKLEKIKEINRLPIENQKELKDYLILNLSTSFLEGSPLKYGGQKWVNHEINKWRNEYLNNYVDGLMNRK